METDILKQAVLIMARRSKSFSQADNRFVSSYTIKQFKVHKSTCSEEKIDGAVALIMALNRAIQCATKRIPERVFMMRG